MSPARSLISRASALLLDHPQVSYGAQDRHKRRVRDENDVLPIPIVKEITLRAHNLDIRRLHRHEHEDEIWALQTSEVGIVLLRKLVYVRFTAAACAARLCVRSLSSSAVIARS